MNFLITWFAQDHHKSIGHFSGMKGSMQDLVNSIGVAGITVKQSWHFAGKNGGFLVIKTPDMATLHFAVVAVGAALDCEIEVTPLLTDKEAMAALAAFVK